MGDSIEQFMWKNQVLEVPSVKARRGPEDTHYNTQNVLECQLRFPARIRPGDLYASAYTDRMQSWDWDKFDKLTEQHSISWTGYANNDPESLLQFFNEYFAIPGTGLLLTRHTNVANGFPLWYGSVYACGPKNEEQPVFSGMDGPHIFIPKPGNGRPHILNNPYLDR